MSKTQPSNLPASIMQRLRNLSTQRKEDLNLVMTRFALERLLYRLSQTDHQTNFILKGALLFSTWLVQPYRPTRDLDLLGFGDNSPEHISNAFKQICQADVEPDGLVFDSDTIQVVEIREAQDYQSHRVKLTALLGKSRIPLQVDIGFGDAITPEAKEIDYPTLLELPSPRIRAYPPETVVAEKFQAMVVHGMANSRMKDYYDIRTLSKSFSFNGKILVEAIRATFERRDTPMPDTTPIALTNSFAEDKDKNTQWRAFVKKHYLEDSGIELSDVVDDLRKFLKPLINAAIDDFDFKKSWDNGGPWV